MYSPFSIVWAEVFVDGAVIKGFIIAVRGAVGTGVGMVCSGEGC